MRRKQLFKAMDVVDLTSMKYLVEIEGAGRPSPEEEVVTVGEEVPSLAEVQDEIDQLRQDWLEEKELLLQRAGEEAEGIRHHAEQEAERLNQQANQQASEGRAALEQELADLREREQQQLARAREETNQSLQQLRDQAASQGREEGYQQGFEQGSSEVQRLIRQLHQIISATLNRREEAIASLETELLDLCFLMVRKVIKRLTSEAQDIIIHNMSEALAHLRSRSQVVIHVHPDDLQLASEKKQDFIDAVEMLQGVSLVEDSGLDRGGCLIETDFGEIDATIGSQLRSIEDRIRTSRPLRSQLSGKPQTQRLQARSVAEGRAPKGEDDGQAETRA